MTFIFLMSLYKIRQKSFILVLLIFLVSSNAYPQISSKQIDKLVENAMEKFTVARW